MLHRRWQVGEEQDSGLGIQEPGSEDGRRSLHGSRVHVALNFDRGARASFDFEVEEILQVQPELRVETENLAGGAFEILSL